ncbi:TonB-dependent receptor [Edaphobacter bradus]|uniref:TonB-dependent receptor n=1 Tax=Edaphobacter bradus TaxID=2259016 RepID=UPI0021E085F7|nr:TonB-dependent receptor [Edaphobacter bradus]
MTLVVLGGAQWGLAQTAFSVRGSVLDPTGAGISGATVQLETSDGALVSHSQTDPKGDFGLLRVPGGNFSLVVPAYSGFASRTLPLHVTGNVSGIQVALSAEAVSQEMTVGADQSLSTDASANRDTITTTGDELRKLPVFDQDYIAALTPFLDASAGSSGGTTIIVDGVEMKNAGVSVSAIQEVRVNNDPYSAEFSRPSRGRIEIITKPGSPIFHGEANFTFRDSIFNAKYYPATVKPPKSHRIFEGHVAGPVGHGGHTSFISSGTFRPRNIGVVVDAISPNGPVIENVLTTNRDYQASMRVTHDFSANHRLSLGYNVEGSYYTNQGVGGITLPEAGYNQISREDDAIINDRIIITPNLINQLQITFEKDEDVTKSVTDAQSIQVSGSFIGGGAQADVAKTENTIHVNEVVTWSHGKHYIRAGVQLPQFSRRAVDDHSNRLGTFKFSSLASYAGNAPYVFTAQQGVGRGLYWINEFSSFIHDQVKLSPRLQLSLGLRYDWQTFIPDNNNLAPRVSLAYAPGTGKTIVRVGTGVFYDRTGGDFPSIVKLHDGVVLHSVQIQNPSFPSSSGASGSNLPTNLVRFDPHVRTPYAIQYSFGVERQLHKSITLTAAYRGQVQIKSFRSRDANAPILPPNASLTADYPRPNPSYGQIQQIESGGRTLLNALDLSFRGQAGRWFSGQAQYTLSRFEGNTGGIKIFPQDQYHPNDEWGRSDQDRLQRFNLMGNINPDHWLSLGVNATLYSGLPYTETTGDDYFHTGLGNARPTGVGRNTLESGGVASLDLLYSHDFFLTKARDDKARVLSAGVSAFNVLNRTNYTSYIGTLSSPRFGQPTAALAGRQLQFSLGYRF